MHGRGDLHAGLHAQDHAFVGQGGVGAGEGLAALVVAAQDEVDVARLASSQRARQRFKRHSFRQAGQVAVRGHVAAVDEDQPRRRDAGQHAGVDRRRHGVGRGECAAFERAQRGVLPRFLARAGQAVGEQRVHERLPCRQKFPGKSGHGCADCCEGLAK